MFDNRVSRFVRSATAMFGAAAFLFALSQPAFGQCGELVVNGDFEQGNTGFTTGHIYTPAPPGTPPTQTLGQGRYDVLSDPERTHGCFGGVDHTSGTGNVMVVNAWGSPNVLVWAQTVPVLTGTNYSLSAWVNSQCFGINPALLSFRVNGVQVGSPFLAPSTAFNWVQFSDVWNSGLSTTATIEIFNYTTAGSGNDFGLDDISFVKIDETAPTLAVAGPFKMSTPNHEYHTFTLTQLVASVGDDCPSGLSVFISGAGSDEVEDALDLGDGETLEDIVIAADCQSVQLRAERQGNSNGRVYTVFVSASDGAGNTTTVPCYISVRHHTSLAAVNDGIAAGYAVAGSCGLAKTALVSAAPTVLALEQNFPNPFNPSTEIRFTVAERAALRLSVLDHLGREVAVLEEGTVDAGTHTASFNAVNMPSGLYFYRLEAAGQAVTKKMMLMK